MPVTYLEGDATLPGGKGPKIIAQCNNNFGGWGRGFVLAVSKRWPEPERAYKNWPDKGNWQRNPIALGSVQFVLVEPRNEAVKENPDDYDLTTSVYVANIIGQVGIHAVDDVPPVRYEAIERGLNAVSMFARRIGASVHMPRIGCALAGGTWDKMGPLIERALDGVDVYVYDFVDTKSLFYVPAR